MAGLLEEAVFRGMMRAPAGYPAGLGNEEMGDVTSAPSSDAPLRVQERLGARRRKQMPYRSRIVGKSRWQRKKLKTRNEITCLGGSCVQVSASRVMVLS